MSDKDSTILHKSSFCNICQGGCSWVEIDGKIIEGRNIMTEYASPTKENPYRTINICDSCKNMFKSIAKELLQEEGILKKK